MSAHEAKMRAELFRINAECKTTLTFDEVERMANDTLRRYRQDPYRDFPAALLGAIEDFGIVEEDEQKAAKRAVGTLIQMRRSRPTPSPGWVKAAGPWWERQGRD